jgi:protein-L-isoaspartate(D-aspartate) O-methyltransferase
MHVGRTLAATLVVTADLGCPSMGEQPMPTTEVDTMKTGEKPPDREDPHASRRAWMVETQLVPRGIVDERVLTAMRTVPRDRFVPAPLRDQAEHDGPLPIGHDVTISQPYIVALMTELAEVEAGDRVLDVGTGSGYQAAVLASLGAEVYGIEIVPELAARARETIASLGLEKITVREGDGYRGWPEHAPYAAIIVAAAAPEVPQPLVDQLAIGGILVVPVGSSPDAQELLTITRTERGFDRERILPVRFVPMTGEVRER